MEMSGKKWKWVKKIKRVFYSFFLIFYFFLVFILYYYLQLPKVDNPSRSLERSLLGPRFLLWLTRLCHHSRWWYTHRHTSNSYHWIQSVCFLLRRLLLPVRHLTVLVLQQPWFVLQSSIFLNGSFNRWRFFVDKWLRLLLRASTPLLWGFVVFRTSSLFFLGRPRDFFFLAQH